MQISKEYDRSSSRKGFGGNEELTTAQQRIHEFTIRQIYYASSMVAKLNAAEGKWHYKVFGWIGDSKILVIEGKYENQDPLELILVALFELHLKKIKLGVPVANTSQRALR